MNENNTRPHFSAPDIAAILLVGGMLTMTAVRLAKDDAVQMAYRVIEMNRRSPIDDLPDALISKTGASFRETQ